jgi:hypothetical protein
LKSGEPITSPCGVVYVDLRIESYVLDTFSSVFVLLFGSALTLVLIAAAGGFFILLAALLDNKEDDQHDV